SEATLRAWATPATTWADVVLRGEIAEHWIDRASFEELIADTDDWTGMDLRSPAHLLRAVLDVGRAMVPAVAPSQAGGSAPASAIARLADEITRLEKLAAELDQKFGDQELLQRANGERSKLIHAIAAMAPDSVADVVVLAGLAREVADSVADSQPAEDPSGYE